MFPALLDTCVLWPSKQRDFLLSLAVVNLYRPLWSAAILEELQYCEIDKLTGKYGIPQDEAESRAARLIETMRDHFDDAEVQNWESYDGTFGLTDPNDEHVIAAAVAGHAGAIVTDNLKHFPPDKVPPGIQVIAPSEFAANTVAVAPQLALQAVTTLTARFKKPPMSVDEFLSVLRERYGMDEAVELINDVR
ncbi:PIN domain-containing protein [Kribbella sp. VKM Ac-2568]|uniref:PIN domain-containing protein n=1 Tax=Kribbella sp. VKM Ac-2568 TaxID=2512219 RepID=UPI00104F8CC3|nr:PIN domain-containing protein [Kribbella sp. VKM Ac-2568]TCM49431.1 PIN domain-containing protein [Kribbella sp. VKM Ac-2568]